MHGVARLPPRSTSSAMGDTLSFRMTTIAAAGLLAGCATVSLFGAPQIQALYTRDLALYATQSGEFATIVRGNPFGPGVDGEAIASVLRSPPWIRVTKFTTNPKPDTRSAYNIVLLFDPVRPGAGDSETCVSPQSEPVGGRSNAQMTRVVVTFCANGRAASSVEGRIAVTSAPTDPAFSHALQRALMEMLPPRNPRIEEASGSYSGA